MTDDTISRQWLMGCVTEGWIKFDTEKDKNRFVHLVRDIAPSAERKGHWYKNSTLINCSVCKHCSWSVNAYEDLVKTFKYCPNCGARMESE